MTSSSDMRLLVPRKWNQMPHATGLISTTTVDDFIIIIIIIIIQKKIARYFMWIKMKCLIISEK